MISIIKKWLTSEISLSRKQNQEQLYLPPKTRVLPFTETINPWYVAQYFYNKKWKPFTKNCTRYNSLHLWTNRQTQLFEHFDDAVDFCKQWKSLREIIANRAFLDREYEEEVQNFKKQIDAKQKTWHSESC